jgi:hypothetical protein
MKPEDTRMILSLQADITINLDDLGLPPRGPHAFLSSILAYRQDNASQVLAFPFHFSAHLLSLFAH